MKYTISEDRLLKLMIENNLSIREGVIDDIEDDKLLKIIDKLVRHVYGKELRMEENKDGYLRFFSSGPVAPYHRNLAGRVWMDDNRLIKVIKNFFGTNWDETLALISFYFSAKYKIKTMDAKPHSNWEDWEDFDYKKFDDPNYVLTDYDEQY
jgi:hypothetical protein